MPLYKLQARSFDTFSKFCHHTYFFAGWSAFQTYMGLLFFLHSCLFEHLFMCDKYVYAHGQALGVYLWAFLIGIWTPLFAFQDKHGRASSSSKHFALLEQDKWWWVGWGWDRPNTSVLREEGRRDSQALPRTFCVSLAFSLTTRTFFLTCMPFFLPLALHLLACVVPLLSPTSLLFVAPWQAPACFVCGDGRACALCCNTADLHAYTAFLTCLT